MKKPRFEHWPQALFDHIEAVRNKPFEWGIHDCCLFAADCVKAMTGKDYMSAYRGLYETEEQARELGGGKIRARITSLLGDPVSPTLAQRGDVMLMTSGDNDIVGICVGVRIAFVSPEGLQYLPLSKAELAWHI